MVSPENINQYEERINRVITYICKNIVKELSLDELSKVACFSKFHFLRIFKAYVGETTGDFIRRIRIEKAAYFLTYNPSASITNIALDCGFSSSQNFAKAFRAYYNTSPLNFRNNIKNQILTSESNPGNVFSNTGKDIRDTLRYIDIVNGKTVHLETDSMKVASQVSIKEYPDVTVAYIRKNENYTFSFICEAFKELYDWAYPRGLITKSRIPLSVFWDNVAVTPMDKRRFDVCIPIDKSINTASPVNKQVLAGGKYAVYHASIENFEFYKHWNRFLKFWFPSSGFIPDDRPCFERIHNPFNTKDDEPLEVEICVPIKYI